jgi:hypothetical protein
MVQNLHHFEAKPLIKRLTVSSEGLGKKEHPRGHPRVKLDTF